MLSLVGLVLETSSWPRPMNDIISTTPTNTHMELTVCSALFWTPYVCRVLTLCSDLNTLHMHSAYCIVLIWTHYEYRVLSVCSALNTFRMQGIRHLRGMEPHGQRGERPQSPHTPVCSVPTPHTHFSFHKRCDYLWVLGITLECRACSRKKNEINRTKINIF